MVEDEKWYCAAGIGNQGCEMLICNTVKSEVTELIPIMELRARFNAHRDIKIYVWIEDFEVTFEKMAEPEYTNRILGMDKLTKQAVAKAGEMLKSQYSINEVIVTPLQNAKVTEENFSEMVAELVAETLFQVNQLRGW